MDTYKDWLKKEIEKTAAREDAQMLNYQETGNPRYQREQYKAEYMGRALTTALEVEEGRNPKVESCQRSFQGKIAALENHLVTGDVEGALKLIQVHKRLGL